MGSGETVSPVQKKGCCPSPEQAREHQPSAYRSPASASTASDARVVVLFDRVWHGIFVCSVHESSLTWWSPCGFHSHVLGSKP